MKIKLLFWGGVLFLALGLNAKDATLFYFFSVHFFMLHIAVFLHKISYTPKTEASVEPLPATETAKK